MCNNHETIRYRFLPAFLALLSLALVGCDQKTDYLYLPISQSVEAAKGSRLEVVLIEVPELLQLQEKLATHFAQTRGITLVFRSMDYATALESLKADASRLDAEIRGLPVTPQNGASLDAVLFPANLFAILSRNEVLNGPISGKMDYYGVLPSHHVDLVGNAPTYGTIIPLLTSPERVILGGMALGSDNVPAALVFCNDLLSPELQGVLARTTGLGPALPPSRLSPAERARLEGNP